MATNTYYSPFFPATEVVGTKGTTIAVVPSAVVGGVQDEIDKINDKLEDYQGGGTVDNTPPGAVTNLVVSSNLTDTDADLLITWTPPSDDDLAGFDVAVAEGTGTFIRFTTSGFNYKISRVRRNQLYKVQVRAFDRVANAGPWTSIVEHTTARDTVPPANVSGIRAETAYETAFLYWNNPADSDLARVDVHLYDTNNNVLKAVSVAATPNGTGTVSFTKIPKATNYYVIIYSVDTSGNSSTGIQSSNFATASGINLNDFTPGLQPTQTVNGLPSPTGYIGPALVFNQADGKLYRYTGGKFEVRTSGADIIDGTLTANKIATGTITAAQIAAGAITANVLAIGDSSNLVRDPTVTSYDCWGKGVGSPAYSIIPGTGQYAGNYILIPYAAGEQQVGSLPMPVTQGEQYYASGILDATSNSGGGGARLHITWYSDTGGTTYISDSIIGVAYNGWTGSRTSATVTAPTSAKTARLIFTRLPGGSANSNFAEPIFKAVLGGTLIKDGAIQTNHITVGTLNGDRISAGTIDADRIKANSVLAGSVKVGTTSLETITNNAVNSSVTSWNMASTAAYRQDGNRIGKYAGNDGVWDWNVYTAMAISNGCMVKARLTTTDVFFGLTRGNPQLSYTGMDWSWHRSSDGTVSVWGGGNRLAYWNAADLGADTVDFSIVYDGKTVKWYSNNVMRYSAVAESDYVMFGAFTSAYNQRWVDRFVFAPAQDNSLNRADPAKRINEAFTAIDPGKILVSGGTYLRDWRQGGDETKIAGGSLSANTIDANKLKIGNRGLSFLGIDFQYNPVQGWVEWTEGYVYYVDNNNNAVGEYIAPGNTGASPPHLFLYWFPGAGRVNFNQNNPASNDSVMLASWWGGSRITANYGGTIINGDRITTNTINANKIVAGTITATQIAAGTITTDKMTVGSATGNRLVLTNNLIQVIDAAGNVVVRMGVW